jgi:hypothetical protein
VLWSRAVLNEADFQRIKYGRWEEWIKFSNGTRYTVQAADNFRQGAISGPVLRDIFGTIRRLVAGERLPPILLVGSSLNASEFVLLEGHVRATSFLLVGGKPIDALVGVSGNIKQWVPY